MSGDPDPAVALPVVEPLGPDVVPRRTLPVDDHFMAGRGRRGFHDADVEIGEGRRRRNRNLRHRWKGDRSRQASTRGSQSHSCRHNSLLEAQRAAISMPRRTSVVLGP